MPKNNKQEVEKVVDEISDSNLVDQGRDVSLAAVVDDGEEEEDGGEDEKGGIED